MSIPFSWIYLVYDPYTGLYKIGKSDQPEVRLKQLIATNGTIPAAPQEYQLVEAWLVEEKYETWLHDYFKDYRVRGEWFDLAELYEAPDPATIAQRMASTFFPDARQWVKLVSMYRIKLEWAYQGEERLKRWVAALSLRMKRKGLSRLPVKQLQG